MQIQVNIGDPKAGKTYKKTVAEDDAKVFFGKKIGDTIKGELLQLPGYEFSVTGGSDYCGFPMRSDVEGTLRKRILIAEGIGLRPTRAGRRVRKAVAGNTVYARTAQLNVKVTKHGAGPIEQPTEQPAAAAE